MKINHEIELGGRKLTLEIGELAQRTKATVLAKYGETIVLATVCSQPASSGTDFLPLTVDYRERLYAGGKISTSRFIKREGRPSDEAILSSRLIDRLVRPLFDPYFNDEIQVIVTVLSYDGENDPQILAAVAASAALSCSNLPWNGPVGTVKIGLIENELIPNPTEAEMSFSDLELVMAVSPDGVVMIEGQAAEISEKLLTQAFKLGAEYASQVRQAITAFSQKAGVKKETALTKTAKKLEDNVKNFIQKNYLKKIDQEAISSEEWIEGALTELFEKFGEAAAPVNKFALRKILEEEIAKIIAERIFKGKRLDGRKPDEIRKITAAVDLLPRTHGSALFSRGDTQVLSTVTLGSPALEQLIEGMAGEETKRFMHHYNFPPFSTGEVKRLGYPSRREIGHGALAEKALLPVIPEESQFPYTIRVVSEVLSSAGSTSMASVCGSSLALMDAGVPISQAVAGISIGSVSKNGKRILLSDIAYAEDSKGEMDFKVAGTKNGVTAIQMDLKIPGIDQKTLELALEKARVGKLKILTEMNKVLSTPREKLSPFAPKIKVLKIDPSQIGEVVGSGGRVIRQIMSQTGTVIEIEDDGTISISGPDEESCAKAASTIEGITKKVAVGEVYEGAVKRILPFGAMVEFLPGREGLVHVSQLAPFRVRNISDVVKIGQKVKVKVTEIDDLGRTNLSMRFGKDDKGHFRKQSNFRPRLKA